MKLWRVVRTEALANFRDRRTVLSSLILGPVLGPMLFAVLFSVQIAQLSENADKPIEVAMVGAERAPSLVTYLAQAGIDRKDVEYDRLGLEEAVKAGDEPFGLSFPDDVEMHFRAGKPMRIELINDSSVSSERGSVRRIEGALEVYAARLTDQRLLLRGVPAFVSRPLIVDNVDTSTAAGRATIILGMLSYFLLGAALYGGMYLATDATAGERERGSLEPLLLLPVSRTDLALGKVLATTLFASISIVLSLVIFYFSLQRVPFEELGMTPNFSVAVIGKAALVFVPFAFLGAALLNVVAAYTKSYREAQTYLGITILAPTFPILFASIVGVRTATWMYTIPALSQHLVLQALLKGERVPSAGYAITVLLTLGIGAVLCALLVRRYRNEALLG
ncbi:MAG: ABC transporter permease [Myxococcota bacterium]